MDFNDLLTTWGHHRRSVLREREEERETERGRDTERDTERDRERSETVVPCLNQTVDMSTSILQTAVLPT